jgi:hypothetical protein
MEAGAFQLSMPLERRCWPLDEQYLISEATKELETRYLRLPLAEERVRGVDVCGDPVATAGERRCPQGIPGYYYQLVASRKEAISVAHHPTHG